MSVPRPRLAHDLPSRRRAPTIANQARGITQSEERVRSRKSVRRATQHRLTWFETSQGLAFFAFVMLGATNGLVGGLLILLGIAMCAPALIAAGVTGRTRKPIQLVLAVAWAILGTIYILVQLG